MWKYSRTTLPPAVVDERIISIRKRYYTFAEDIQFSPEMPKCWCPFFQRTNTAGSTNLSRHSQVVDLEFPKFEVYAGGSLRKPVSLLDRGINRFTLRYLTVTTGLPWNRKQNRGMRTIPDLNGAGRLVAAGGR